MVRVEKLSGWWAPYLQTTILQLALLFPELCRTLSCSTELSTQTGLRYVRYHFYLIPKTFPISPGFLSIPGFPGRADGTRYQLAFILSEPSSGLSHVFWMCP